MRDSTPTDRRSLSAPVRTAILLFLLCLPDRLYSQVIDSESLPAPGNGTGGLIVRNQFAASGLVFNSPTALDFSQGIAIRAGLQRVDLSGSAGQRLGANDDLGVVLVARETSEKGTPSQKNVVEMGADLFFSGK